MGWGILMGVGKGLTDFSGIMGEHRKFNWELTKDELKWQRDQALEALRAKSAKDLQASSQEFKAGEGVLDRASREGIANLQLQSDQEKEQGIQSRFDAAQKFAKDNKSSMMVDPTSGRPYTDSEWKQLPEDQKSKAISQDSYELNVAKDRQLELLKATKKVSKEEANELADKYEKIYRASGGVFTAKEQMDVHIIREQLDPEKIYGKAAKISAEVEAKIFEQLSATEKFQDAIEKGDMNTAIGMFTESVKQYERGRGTDAVDFPDEYKLNQIVQEINKSGVTKPEALKALRDNGLPEDQIRWILDKVKLSGSAAGVNRNVTGGGALTSAYDRAYGRSVSEGVKEDIVKPAKKFFGWLEEFQNKQDQSNFYSP